MICLFHKKGYKGLYYDTKISVYCYILLQNAINVEKYGKKKSTKLNTLTQKL